MDFLTVDRPVSTSTEKKEESEANEDLEVYIFINIVFICFLYNFV